MAFTDNFTGNDNDLLEDRAGWTLVTDGAYRATVWTNALTFRAGGGGADESLWICTDQGSANHYTQIKDASFDPAGTNFACCRLVDIDNFIAWYLAGLGAAGSRLMKMVAGVLTDLVTVQGANNDVIKVTCEGNTIKFYIDDVQQGGDQTITDHNTETSQGFVTGQTVGSVTFRDDFEAGPMAVDYEITAEGGSYAETGQAVNLLKGSLIDIGAGTFVETGQPVSLLKGFKIPIGAGAYAESGQVVALLKGSKVGIGSGSFALTGQDIGVLYDRIFNAEAGAYVETGQIASLLKGSYIDIAAGSIVLTGQVVDFLKTSLIEIGTGIYVLDGADVGLDYSGIATFPIIFDVTPRGRIFELTARTRIFNITPRERIFDREEN